MQLSVAWAGWFHITLPRQEFFESVAGRKVARGGWRRDMGLPEMPD